MICYTGNLECLDNGLEEASGIIGSRTDDYAGQVVKDKNSEIFRSEKL